ncbi:FAD-dependent monooxygenase [Caenimonas sedimenti]|uniref:FAD-dependent monooxygenase n=1 Tax=Caenimonas sedimenti TaxID=2596921 RepID=UPI00164808B0|nr:FAD-dependent monooxygenase [Caenimonas sedimenti]
MKASLHVGVVGGGVAGLACALAAARGGARVQVFEERPEHMQVDTHVEVVPSMLRDLVRIGVGDACVRAGFPFRRTNVLDQAGRKLFAIEAEALAGPRLPATLGITRSSFHEGLREAAVAAGCQMNRGLRVTDVGADGSIEFARSAPVRADLVVLACGSESPLRARVFGASPPVRPGPAWSYFLASRPVGLDEAVLASARDGRKAHVVPVSSSQVGVRMAPAPHQLPHASAPAAWPGELLAGFAGVLGALGDGARNETRAVLRDAHADVAAADWHRGALLAVGDCAHRLPPHFGQSAAQAIEDAVVLGELLERGGSVDELSAAFVRRRRDRVAEVAALTTLAARWDTEPEPATDLPAITRALARLVHQPA